MSAAAPKPRFPKRELEEEGREIDEDWPERFVCSHCDKQLEPMEPYIMVVVNNTDEPEQRTFRFCQPRCLVTWDAGTMHWQGNHP
jgi:hypothetical protein